MKRAHRSAPLDCRGREMAMLPERFARIGKPLMNVDAWSGIQFSSSSGVSTAFFGGAETGAEDGARLSERSNVSVP